MLIDTHAHLNFPDFERDLDKLIKSALEAGMETLKKLAQNPKVVAMGECGLDYHLYQSGGITDPQIQKGVFHCFSGSAAFLKKILKLGFYVGFDGNLTFKNAQSLQEIAKITPLERILLETDSPYLTPEPYRGLRNTPANVKIIAEFLARLLGVSFAQICPKTNQNAQEVFTQIR